LICLPIVRSDETTIRAFHNLCRHRAGPVASGDGKGRADGRRREPTVRRPLAGIGIGVAWSQPSAVT
jgi:hypothetical protein